MTGDILTRLRATERAIWDGDDAEERRAFIKMVADEIQRLRTMLAHGLTMGYTCEGCAICDDLKTFHNQVLTND